MTKTNCGLTNNYQNLDLFAKNDKSTFTFNNLRYKTAEYKIEQYQACTYKIMNPPGGYKGGKVYLTI